MDVTCDNLKILGIVRLPVSLGKSTLTLRLDSYVASNFALLSDGLLRLSALNTNSNPDISAIHGRIFKAMEKSVRLASPWGRPVNELVVSLAAHSVPIVQDLSSVSISVTDTTRKPKSADDLGEWKSVNAIRNHEIPHRTAMHIPVSVPNATVGCNICHEEPSQIKALALESTLNTFREGNRTLAFYG